MSADGAIGAPIRTSPYAYAYNLPVVLDGSGMRLLPPFLRERLTYERVDVKEALGIFTSTHFAIK